MTETFHLIHANIALMRDEFDSQQMSGFVSQMEVVGEIASQSPGFVAQPYPADSGDVYNGRYLLNLSIWESVESLRAFTYAGRHAEFLKRRLEWFQKIDKPTYVLFWFPVGQVPSELEVSRRIQALTELGPTTYAFDFKHNFTAQEARNDDLNPGENYA